MSDEFWNIVGSEEKPKVWKCRRFLDDAWTADQETQLFDVVCGYAVSKEFTDGIRDQCSQCDLYRLQCTCGGKYFCSMRSDCHYVSR